MLDKLKEYQEQVNKGYRNVLACDELTLALNYSVSEIERLQLELLKLKRDIGWTNQ